MAYMDSMDLAVPCPQKGGLPPEDTQLSTRNAWLRSQETQPKVVATCNHVGGSFNLFIPSFRIWDYVLHVEHVSCVITNCGQNQWVIPSPLNRSLGFAGGKSYQKITIPIFRLVLQNFAIPGCFPYMLFYRYMFSLLSSGWLVIAVFMALFQSRELVKYLE